MRPKKVILLVDANEQNLSALAFSLATNGYEVLCASSFTEGLALFRESDVDLVAVTFAGVGGKNGDELIIEMKELRPFIPMILMANPAKFSSCHADRILPVDKVPMAEVLECLKVMTARKRGPRKGTKRVETPEPVAAGVA